MAEADVRGVDLAQGCAHIGVAVLDKRLTPRRCTMVALSSHLDVLCTMPLHILPSHLIASHLIPISAHHQPTATRLHSMTPPPNTSTRPLQRQPAPPTHMSVSVPSEMGHDPYCGGPRSKHETASLACYANSSPFTVTLQALSPQSLHCESPCPPCPSSLVPDPSSAAAPPPCLLPKRGAAYR
jgi:hypothetical protein